MARPSGGWIARYTAPAQAAARGVWSLRDQFNAVASNSWPGVDPYFSSVSLLLHMDGSGTSFADSSTYGRAVTAGGNATQSTAQSKFGGSSLLLDGSSWLSMADSASLELASNPFAIEMWIRTTSSTQYATLVSRSTTSFTYGMWSWLINLAGPTSGEMALYIGDYSTSSAVMTSTGCNIRDGSWHHIAISRNGTQYGMYFDGSRVASATVGSTTAVTDVNGGINIGRDQFYSGRTLVGNMDEIRITIGSARAYTGSTISVPQAAVPDR